jgi:hypothetical protein
MREVDHAKAYPEDDKKEPASFWLALFLLFFFWGQNATI